MPHCSSLKTPGGHGIAPQCAHGLMCGKFLFLPTKSDGGPLRIVCLLTWRFAQASSRKFSGPPLRKAAESV